MILKKLRLFQFRNHERLELFPCAGLTVLTGGNGQGKTNVLEAVYLCSAGKSHRASRDAELVMREKNASYVMAQSEENGELREIEMSLDSSGAKRVKLDKQPISRLADMLGHIIAVMISPDDLRLVKGAPGDRRRFLDLSLCRIDPVYCRALTDYQRALLQRNALLKRIAMGFAKENELDAWDGALCRNGVYITNTRSAYVIELDKRVREFGAYLSDKTDALEAVYSTNCPSSEEAFLKALESGKDEDVRRGMTQKGAHHDEIALNINGLPIREYGSQGQQRCAMTALKLAEAELISVKIKSRPILLLDDVLSELDTKRRRLLLRAVEPYQTLLTCTEYDSPFKGDKYIISPGAAAKL